MFETKMKRLGMVLLTTSLCLIGCGKSNPKPDVLEHLVSVPSTNSYVITGQVTFRADGPGPRLIQYSTDGNNFQDIPYIHRTFGDDHAWYEQTFRDTRFWIRISTEASTNQVPISLSITRE